MQGLQQTLQNLTVSGTQKVFSGVVDTMPLIDQRIFYIAPRDMIKEVAEILTACIFSGLQKGKDGYYDRFGWETVKRRASDVIDILFNDDRYLAAEFSRTQVCIAKEVFQSIRREYRPLSSVFVTRLEADVKSKFNGAWMVRLYP